MKQEKISTFQEGIRDGIPIALGYISVSFTFGMMAVNMGLPIEAAVVISFTNLTSAGQFAALQLIVSAGSLMELALTQLIINLRYALMALSLTQKIEPSVSTGKRMVMAYGITDEIFALASAKEGKITMRFYCGLMLLPILGWTFGTFLGAAANTILPQMIRSAMGIAIYGMFLAIIIPPAKGSFALRRVILTAALLSCLFALLQDVFALSSGFVIIICTVASAALAAYFHPLQKEDV